MTSETLKNMKSSTLKSIGIQLIACLVLILLPNFLPNSIFKIIGIVGAVLGSILLYFVYCKPKEFKSWKSYILPGLLLIGGLFTFFQTNEALSLVACAIGTAVIIKGASSIFFNDSPVKDTKHKIFGFVSIALGVSIIIFSNSIGAFFSYYIALILLYHTVIDIILYLDLKKL